MKPEVVERGDVHVLAVRVSGKPTQIGELVPAAWAELKARLADVPEVVDASKQIGFLLMSEYRGPNGEIISYIGTEISELITPLEGTVCHTIKGGKYAVFKWHGSFLTKEFEGFYPSIFQALKKNKLKTDEDQGWIELYDDATHNWNDKANPKNRLQVCFPLKRSTVARIRDLVTS